MTQSLPYRGLRSISQLSSRNNTETDDDAETGYFADFDLNYPDERREKLKKFPFWLQN